MPKLNAIIVTFGYTLDTTKMAIIFAVIRVQIVFNVSSGMRIITKYSVINARVAKLSKKLNFIKELSLAFSHTHKIL